MAGDFSAVASAGVELLVKFWNFYNRHIVVAIVLGDEAHGRPVVFVVVGVVGDELLCVGLVQSVNLNSALQGVAQQEHLHLEQRREVRGNSTATEGLGLQRRLFFLPPHV